LRLKQILFKPPLIHDKRSKKFKLLNSLTVAIEENEQFC